MPLSIRRFHHWLARSSRARARSRRRSATSGGAQKSFMGGELRGQLLPFAHQPRHLLLGALALRRDGAHAVAVRIETRIGERVLELTQPCLQRLDLTLDLLESASELSH